MIVYVIMLFVAFDFTYCVFNSCLVIFVLIYCWAGRGCLEFYCVACDLVFDILC